MGCSDSKVVDTRDGAVIEDKKVQKKPSTPTKESENLTVKDFFDAAFELPKEYGEEPYIQKVLPDFYVEQKLVFENDNVDDATWKMKIHAEKKSKTPQEKNSKKNNTNAEIMWHYRKPPNRKYVEPDDSLTISLEFEAGAKKKHVVVVSGLYLGSKSASAANVFDEIDVESTHSLVLLGNLFDMLSIDSFHQKPTEITSIESLLADSGHVLQSIKTLASAMNVYYMLGSHDTDLTRVAMERLLGDSVIFVSQTNLILCVKSGNENYRVRLTTGRQWDLFNDRTLPKDKLLVEKPIGHYLGRAAENNPKFSVSSLMRPIVSAIPSELDKDFLQKVSKKPLQDRITSKMLLCAFQLSKPEDMLSIKCVIDEGKYIGIQSILEYPYIKYLLELHREETLMSMIKALIGDYTGVARSCGEDVMVTGVGDEASVSKLATDAGQDIICAGTGSCSKRSHNMTMLKILYPKQGSNGKVEVLSLKPDAKPQTNGPQKIERLTDKSDTLSVESL